MTIPYHHLAELFYNRPLLLTPEKGHVISGILLARIQSGQAENGERPIEELQAFAPVEKADGSVELHSPRASRFVGEYPIDPVTGRPAPYRVKNGIAIITMVGTLVNRGAWIGASSGLITYEGIKHQIATAAADATVTAILIDMQSPGGEVLGCFDTAAAIRKAREVKPVVCFVNGMAASAGYALASSCTKIVSIPEGRVGSIGVFMAHLDMSGAMQQMGLKATFIFAGAHKVDGNPYEALPKDVHDRFQVEIDKCYTMFVDCVIAGRPQLDDAAIRGTEALMYSGAEALSLGLIDSVGTFEDLLVEMAIPPNVTINIDSNGGEDDEEDLKASAAEGDSMKLTEMGSKAMNALGWATGGDPAPAPAAAPTAPAVPATPATDAAAEALRAENDKLKADIATLAEFKAKSDAEAADKLKAEQDARAAEQAERVKAQAATFVKGLTAHGASARRDLESLYTGAASGTLTLTRPKANVATDATDAEKVETISATISADAGVILMAQLESLAKSIPPAGAAGRQSLGGEKAEAAARVASGEVATDPTAVHFEALSRVEKAGVTQSDPRFAATYEMKRDEVLKEMGHAA